MRRWRWMWWRTGRSRKPEPTVAQSVDDAFQPGADRPPGSRSRRSMPSSKRMEEAVLDEIAALWMAAMRRGDWLEAWRQTDRVGLPPRLEQAAGRFERRPEHLVWDGTPFAGRSVLVRCEHGLGDTL